MEFLEMKDRIAHIIRAKNLTAAEFAVQLGIQPSNVSHLLAGRNNPSLEFVKKLKETFPEYNLDWIVLGKGPMTVSEPYVVDTMHTDSSKNEIQDIETQRLGLQESLFSIENNPNDEKVDQPSSIQKGDLRRIIMVYEDNTFEVLFPR